MSSASNDPLAPVARADDPLLLSDVVWIGERVTSRANLSLDQLAVTGGRIVRVCAEHPDGRTIRHVVYHSPSGLSWGSEGVGSADTALSVLIDAGLDPNEAWRLHRGFARDVVARLPVSHFVLAGSFVAYWLAGRA